MSYVLSKGNYFSFDFLNLKKMRKIQIFLICSVALLEIFQAKNIEPKPRQTTRLRSFAIHPLKTLRDMRKAFELEQKMLKDAERQLLKVKEDLIREKDNELRKKIQLRLGPSSFYKDFHSNRFF
jgi:hypothetical protein